MHALQVGPKHKHFIGLQSQINVTLVKMKLIPRKDVFVFSPQGRS